MDKIKLNEMAFFGYHGDYEEERRLGQKFVVDVEIQLPLQAAGMLDDLRLSVDYAEIFEKVRQVVETEQYRLVETVAERIAAVILMVPSVQAVLVRVVKPSPAVPGMTGSMAVEIFRTKEDRFLDG